MFSFSKSLQLAVLAALATHANADCARDVLEGSAGSYAAAQYMGMSMMLPLAPNATYYENDKKMDPSAGIINKALFVDFTRSIVDTVNCATYTEFVITDPANQHTIGTQIHYDSTGKTITKMESIVTKTGDWFFNVTSTLAYAKAEKWDTIPEAKRDTRAVIKAAGDAYLDRFGSNTVVVPWGQPCARLEGGVYFGGNGANDTCNVGMPASGGLQMGNRRYVIDETLGVVDIFVSFGSAGAGGLPDSHQFRIENGKIRYVHTMTIMTK